MIEICERFVTLGGEAPLSGKPIYLYRFSGCNLECTWCDTQYHTEVNITATIDEIVADIDECCSRFPGLAVMFTGGEPLLTDRILDLLHIIRRLPNVQFYIETNGSVDVRAGQFTNTVYVVDMKSPSSGVHTLFLEANLRGLRAGIDCIKMVLTSDDLEWMNEQSLRIIRQNPGLDIYVSPVADKLNPKDLVEYILNNRLDVKLSLQLHRIIWPEQNRGV